MKAVILDYQLIHQVSLIRANRWQTAVLKKYEVFVICDEVYSELTYTGEAHVSMTLYS